MKLLTVATAFLFCSASVASNSMETRDEGGPIPICLYMTNDYNWNGEGINFCQVGGQCGSNLGDHMSKNISSAGPPKGQTCFIYDGINCTGTGSPPIVYPGYMNLSDPVINFDKRAMSWRCWKHCGYMSSLSSSALPTTLSSSISKTPTATPTSSISITGTVRTLGSNSPASSTASPVVITGTITTIFSHTGADHGVTVVTQTIVASPH